MGLREQGFLAELLGYPEEASAEVDRRRGVLREEGSEAQQARGLPQAFKVLGILGEPRAEHCAHRSAETRREMLKEEDFLPFLTDIRNWLSISAALEDVTTYFMVDNLLFFRLGI